MSQSYTLALVVALVAVVVCVALVADINTAAAYIRGP